MSKDELRKNCININVGPHRSKINSFLETCDIDLILVILNEPISSP